MLKLIRMIIGLRISRQILSTIKREIEFPKKTLLYVTIDSFSDYSTCAVIGYTNQLFVLTAPNRTPLPIFRKVQQIIFSVSVRLPKYLLIRLHITYGRCL